MHTPSTAANRAILRLPFTVSPVSTVEHLRQVLELRHTAYGRHAYEAALKRQMLVPDEGDLNDTTTTMVAVDKTSNRVVGTLRLQSSLDAAVDWPEGTPEDECREGAYTYIDRFAVLPEDGGSGLVASGLIKAAYLWSLGRDSYWATALAVRALSRVYRRRGGMVVRAEGQTVVMPEYQQEPYLLLATPLHEVRGRLNEENPTYSQEFFDRTHPDICVNGMSLPWSELPRAKLELVHG